MARRRRPDNWIIQLFTPILAAAGYRHHDDGTSAEFRRQHLTWWHKKTTDNLVLEVALQKSGSRERLSLVYAVCLEPQESVKDRIAATINDAYRDAGCKRVPLTRDEIGLMDAIWGSSDFLLDCDTEARLDKLMLVNVPIANDRDEALLKGVLEQHVLPILDRLASRKALADYYRSDETSLGMPFWPLAAELGIPGRRFPERLFDLPAIGAPAMRLTTQQMKQGEVTLLNVWSSGNVLCRQGHPALLKLAQLDVAKIYGINILNKKETAAGFLDRHGNPHILCGLDRTGQNVRSAEDSMRLDWNSHRLPYLDVVDGNGFVVESHWGPLTEKDIEAKILPAIEEARVPFISPTIPAWESLQG